MLVVLGVARGQASADQVETVAVSYLRLQAPGHANAEQKDLPSTRCLQLYSFSNQTRVKVSELVVEVCEGYGLSQVDKDAVFALNSLKSPKSRDKVMASMCRVSERPRASAEVVPIWETAM